MQNENGWKPPIGLIILDGIGVLLLALGLTERFMSIGVVPASLRFENFDLVLMGLGGMLMLPLVLNLILRAGKSREDA